ncbi:MAG: phosphoserine aminotransferase, partial [Planktomarina sp.]|nr:phosphoserine aminotransferase [Planktomarina sp.]
VWDFCSSRDWIANLAVNEDTRSVTSVCVKFTDNRIEDPSAFAKAIAKRMDEQGVAFDVGAYRDAPAGLRIWCGATIETADIEAMLPWLEWAYLIELEAQ